MRIGLSKKLFALTLSIVLMFSISMPAFAATAPFGTAGAGANPFNPRGYSIMEDVNGDGTNENVWLQSQYIHNELVGNTYSAKRSGAESGQYYITSGDKQMDAWVDKGQLTNGFNMPYQRGFTSDPNADVRYSFVVSINDGPFVSIPYAEAAEKNLLDSNGNIDATQGLSAFSYATRNVIDPDGIGNQWVYPINFMLKPGTKYTFAYLRGFAANNGMSLILSKDVTADGQTGYTGVLQGPTLTDAEKAEWTAHNQDMYQYSNALTALGTGVSTGKTVYSIEFKDFYHTLQTYADLAAFNSKLSEVTTFADGVKDTDYQLGNYRKSSVEALKTLINEINAKTDIREELQTSVDALTKQLSDALNYAKEPAISVSGITLDKNRADIYVGDSLTLNVTVLPEKSDNTAVTWASSDDQVATVENGVVKSVSAGNVTITAKTADGGYTATCTIAINPAVSVSPATISVQKGSTQQFTAALNGTNTSSQNITWSVTGAHSGTSVSSTGLLTVAAGESAASLTVTAASKTDANKYATAAVTLTASEPKQVSTVNAVDNGGSVTGLNGTVLPSGTSFIISPIVQSESTSTYNAVSKSIASDSTTQGKELIKLYNFTLQNGNTAIEPNGYVQVRIPIPESLRGRAGLEVVRINADHSLTLMHATNDGSYITFKTNHLSVYGIIADKVKSVDTGSTQSVPNPETGNTSSSPLPLFMVSSAAFLVFAIAIAIRKKRFRIIKK